MNRFPSRPTWLEELTSWRFCGVSLALGLAMPDRPRRSFMGYQLLGPAWPEFTRRLEVTLLEVTLIFAPTLPSLICIGAFSSSNAVLHVLGRGLLGTLCRHVPGCNAVIQWAGDHLGCDAVMYSRHVPGCNAVIRWMGDHLGCNAAMWVNRAR